MERLNGFEELRRQTQAENLVLTTRDHENRLLSLEKTSEKTLGMTREIHTALLGTLDKPGLVLEIKEHSKFIAGCVERHKESKKAKIDWFRWAERGAIAAALGWIITKIKIGLA